MIEKMCASLGKPQESVAPCFCSYCYPGIRLSNRLNLTSTTHLISYGEEGLKVQRALQAGLPVHGIAFLVDLVKQSFRQEQERAALARARAETELVKTVQKIKADQEVAIQGSFSFLFNRV